MVRLGPYHIVLDGDTALPLQKGHNPQFSAHVCCGQKDWVDQDATCYGGRPRHRRHCVRWGPSYSFPKMRAQHSHFLPSLLWPNCWMDVLDGDSAPPWKGAYQHPTFRPMSIVAKRSPISSTAELLLCFLCHGTSIVASVVVLVRPTTVANLSQRASNFVYNTINVRVSSATTTTCVSQLVPCKCASERLSR